MHDSTPTTRPQRPRTRRGLAYVVGAALMVTPLALAPASQAQLQLRASPDLVQQIVQLVQQIISGLGHTLSTPLGEKAPNSSARPCQPTGLSELLSCLVAPLQNSVAPGPSGKAKVKATMKNGKVTRMRAVK